MLAPKGDRRSEANLASQRCQQCGECFEPSRPHQRFCRPSCRRAAFTDRGQRRLPLGELDELFEKPFE
jgi:hypothetical protein